MSSSESDDEFQSADEGSESEDFEPADFGQKVQTQLQLPSPSEKAVDNNTREEILKEEKEDECKESGLSFEVSVSDLKIQDDNDHNANTSDLEKSEFQKDLAVDSALDKRKVIDESSILPTSNETNDGGKGNVKDANKTLYQMDSECEVQVSASSGDSTTTEKTSAEKDEGGQCLQEDSKPQQCIKEGFTEKQELVKGSKTKQMEISEMQDENEQFKESMETRDTQHRVEMPASETTPPALTEPENKVLTSSSAPKPIRVSKIGMKKPREKLGERLGAKKLGTKMEKKPLDSISSADVIKSKESHEATTTLRSQTVDVNREDDAREEDDKAKKRQQWEEQQERWHQALSPTSEMKEAEDGDGWGGSWGGWGSSLLSAASTLTREVGRGVGTVMETVESSLGAPNPEVLAREAREQDLLRKALAESTASQGEKEKDGAEVPECPSSSDTGASKEGVQGEESYGLRAFSLGSLVSGVSGALETASSKVLLGGLDTLEVIGRKAMDVIQEGDPGLRKKRAFLTNKKPNLSQMLQEARLRAAEEEKEGLGGDGQRSSKKSQKPSFYQAWEATEGPIHLEALSLVAKQCQSKMASMTNSLPPYVLDKLHAVNAIIKSTCELQEDTQLEGDPVEQITTLIAHTGLPLHSQKLCEAWSLVKEKATIIQDSQTEDWDEMEQDLYGALAQLVAQLCALGHKGGELALITPDTDPLTLATQFRDLVQIVSNGLEDTADQVCGFITVGASAADLQVNTTITNIYLQAASGNSYLQQSVVLLASVLQYSNTKAAAASL